MTHDPCLISSWVDGSSKGVWKSKDEPAAEPLVKSLTSAYKNGDRLKQPQVSWLETSFNPIEKY